MASSKTQIYPSIYDFLYYFLGKRYGIYAVKCQREGRQITFDKRLKTKKTLYFQGVLNR